MAGENLWQASQAGEEQGRKVPNRNTGLADVVKSITADLKASKVTREKSAETRRGQNIDLLGSLLKGGLNPKSSDAVSALLERGDVSGFGQSGGLAGGGLSNFLGMDRSQLPPGMSMTYREGNLSATMRPESDTARSARISRQGLQRDLNIMQNLFEGVATEEGPSARLSGVFKSVAAKIGTYKELRSYNDYKNGILGRLVITIGGESGSRLSDQDVKRMQALFPDEYNTVGEATIKWAMLKSAVNETAQYYGSQVRMDLTPQEQAVLDKLTPIERVQYGDLGIVTGPAVSKQAANLHGKLEQDVIRKYGPEFIAQFRQAVIDEMGAGDMLGGEAGGRYVDIGIDEDTGIRYGKLPDGTVEEIQ